jgi:DNA-directed RNA polymerase subunit RPC12/RpoP
MTAKKPDRFVAVYCQHCGFIDTHVSVIAIETIKALANTDDAVVDCKQCGSKITVNFTNDTMKVNKKGQYELKDTTQW